MEEKDNILKELQSIAPTLSGIERQMPYAVPEGYFDVLSLEMLAKTRPVFEKPVVPEGYFDSLPNILLTKIKGLEQHHELEAVAPALMGINKKMPFAVPAGYFENFVVTPASQQAPVVSLFPKQNRIKWAVAASIIALAGLFAWQYFLNAPVVNPGQNVAGNITDSVNAELATALQQVGDTSINSELNETGTNEDLSSALYYLDTDNIETALKSISNEEIEAQLAWQAVPLKSGS